MAGNINCYKENKAFQGSIMYWSAFLASKS